MSQSECEGEFADLRFRLQERNPDTTDKEQDSSPLSSHEELPLSEQDDDFERLFEDPPSPH